MIRVLLVDGHAGLHDVLKRCLERRGSIEVVRVTTAGCTAVRLVQELAPDVVVTEVLLQTEMSGIEATRKILALGTNCRVVAFTASGDPRVMQEARRAGMVGYARKGSRDDVIEVVEAVARGETRFPVELPPEEPGVRTDSALTPREWQVLGLVAGGKTINEVAILLNLSVREVEQHVAAIKSRQGMSSDIELIKFAIQVGAASLGA